MGISGAIIPLVGVTACIEAPFYDWRCSSHTSLAGVAGGMIAVLILLPEH